MTKENDDNVYHCNSFTNFDIIYIRVSYMLFNKENKMPIFTISIMKSIRVAVTVSEIILIGIFIVSSLENLLNHAKDKMNIAENLKE